MLIFVVLNVLQFCGIQMALDSTANHLGLNQNKLCANGFQDDNKLCVNSNGFVSY